MRHFTLAPLAILGIGFWLTGTPASAQFAYPSPITSGSTSIPTIRPPSYGPYYQPLLSPYLNMLRGGDPAANYFLGVVPEFQRRSDRNAFIGTLQNQAGLLIPPRPGISDEIDRPLASTGHPSAFNYTGSYFSNITPMRPLSNPFPQRTGPGAGAGSGRWPNYNTSPSPASGPPRR